MASMKRVVNNEASDNKENCTINGEILKSNDLPSVKMVRQSLTTIFRENKRKATMLAKLPSICDETESLIAVGTNGETIGASVVSSDLKAVKKNVHANVSNFKSSTIAGQKTTVNSSNSESVNHKAYQSKTVIQKNVGKPSEAAGPSDSTHIKNPVKKSTDTFPCKICEKKFLLKTTLIAHEKTHIDANSNCPHCQRAFEKPIALSKHLRENCTKISVAAKRKLLAEDMQLAELNLTRQKSSDLQLKTSKSRNLPLRTQISGIYHTPKKLITCHHCGDTFLDVFLFASHTELHATPKPM